MPAAIHIASKRCSNHGQGSIVFCQEGFFFANLAEGGTIFFITKLVTNTLQSIRDCLS